MAPRRLGAFALCVAVGSACSSPANDARSPAVRDSAGIAIVDNQAPRWANTDAWSVDSTPRLVIGEQSGVPEYEFDGIATVLALSDGRIVVHEVTTHHLRLFSKTGEYLRNLGRRGGGPGEFANITSVWVIPGDTIVVFDSQAQRVSRFGPDGAFLDSALLESDQMVVPLGLLNDGRMVVRRGNEKRPTKVPGARRVDSTLILYLSRDRRKSDTVAGVPDREMQWDPMGRGTKSYVFERVPLQVVSGTQVTVADWEEFQLRVFDARGRIARLVRAPFPVVKATSADIDWFKARIRARVPGGWSLIPYSDAPESSGDPEEDIKGLVFAETHPPVVDLLVDSEGMTWARLMVSPEDVVGMGTTSVSGHPTRWEVFDRGGIWLGRVDLPARFRPTQIGADYVLGTSRDPRDDVEHIRMYGLNRGDSRSR